MFVLLYRPDRETAWACVGIEPSFDTANRRMFELMPSPPQRSARSGEWSVEPVRPSRPGRPDRSSSRSRC